MKFVVVAFLSLSGSAFASNDLSAAELFSTDSTLESADADVTEAFDDERAREITAAKIAASGMEAA